MPPESAQTEPFRYAAFISYSHADRYRARAIHRRLEAYVLPRTLRVGRIGRKGRSHPLKPVFRDEDELIPGHGLPERIQSALEQSEYLVVLCSPAAAASPWVEREILEFASLGREQNIVAAVVAGEANAESRGFLAEDEALPRALRFKLEQAPAKGVGMRVGDQPAEPLWVDLKDKESDKRSGLLRVIAALLSFSSLDELVRRDAIERRQRRLNWAFGAIVMALLLFISVYVPDSIARQAMDSRLLGDLETLQSVIHYEEEDGGYVRLDSSLGRREPFSGTYWQIEMPGREPFASRSLWDGILRIPEDVAPEGSPPAFLNLEDPVGSPIRVAVRTVRVEPRAVPVRIIVALDRVERDSQRWRAPALLIGLFGLLGLAFLGWKLVSNRLDR